MIQSSRHYGTGTKAQIQTHTLIDTLSLTKEARIHNGEKTASSMSGAAKLEEYLPFKAW